MKNSIVEILKEQLRPEFIYLFGSYAMGLENNTSDVDIAYYSNKTLSELERFYLSQEIARTIGKEVDLVDVKNTDTLFQNQIISHAEVIYDSNPELRERFEMRVVKEYMRFNEEMEEIWDSYGDDL